MNMIANHPPTAELQALDAAHHMHPFTHAGELAEKGARIITRAKGVTLTDSEGNHILDAMGGLRCVNIGYGRDELAEVAARQMRDFGGMVSIVLEDDALDTAVRFMPALRVFSLAESLGGVESLIEHRGPIEGPDSPTQQDLLRLSVGLENAQDLLDDLDQALGQ